jgi:hypothetical protein
MSSRLAAFVFSAAVASGCAPPHFPEVKNVSELEPEERVVIGQIEYGDDVAITDWVKGSFQKSWPYFSYDFMQLYGPRRLGSSVLGPKGGVFAIRVKKGPAYLYSIAVVTRTLAHPETEWTFPVLLKLPPSAERCTFAGTIVLHISGDAPAGLPWYALPGFEQESGSHTKVLVFDTFDRDRAALASHVAGCDLKKALAAPPPRAELEALLRRAAQRQAAEQKELEAATNVTP